MFNLGTQEVEHRSTADHRPSLLHQPPSHHTLYISALLDCFWVVVRFSCAGTELRDSIAAEFWGRPIRWTEETFDGQRPRLTGADDINTYKNTTQ